MTRLSVTGSSGFTASHPNAIAIAIAIAIASELALAVALAVALSEFGRRFILQNTAP